MTKELRQLKISSEKVKENIFTTLHKIKNKGLDEMDMNLVNKILTGLEVCYCNRIDEFIQKSEHYLDRDREFEAPRIFPKPKLSDCLNKTLHDYHGVPINFFPSNVKGECHPQCVVMSSGDWDFGDTKMRNDILAYWYRCFYKNRFTLIFSESWQSNSWNKWEKMIDAYVSEQKIEVSGNWKNVNHTVIIIEYSDDMVHLRYHEKSI